MNIKEIEKISKALGDSYRLQIIEAIKKDPGWTPCSSIIEMLNLAQSTVSHHLKQLVDADLLLTEKEGRCARYSINAAVFNSYIQSLAPYARHTAAAIAE